MATTYNPRIVTNGLVLCLDAGNTKSYPGSGTTWTDISRNGNNGTLTNGPTFSSANKGSIVFDGVDDHIAFAWSESLNIGGRNLTLSAWINSEELASAIQGEGIIVRENSTLFPTYVARYEILLLQSGNPAKNYAYFRIYNAAGLIGTKPLELNTFYNITCVYRAGVQEIYVNGIFDTSSVGNIDITQSATDVLRIGRRFVALGDGAEFKGKIPFVCIYNRALSASEVAQNFNATRGRYGV